MNEEKNIVFHSYVSLYCVYERGAVKLYALVYTCMVCFSRVVYTVYRM